ncbi:hypothetical protein KQP61_21590 [Bacteroides faecis]|jgi:hypothetical protein|uniref:hypothetical protein n=1 Tax=Bacteroides faecis TaxID=674529 RepID=UPI000D646F7B|nr:hypothetical protein [Bacteroides faecis]UYU56715.1 hypothetical protein KQP61_21590 [Bacteroides faecis]DAN67674.1 MAG TPA: major capsid protein [Caudoviricetes sp.]
MKNRFSQFVPAVMAILGIKDWNKDADKKNALLAEEKEKLKNMGFNETFLTGFCEALSNDFPDDKSQGSTENGTVIPDDSASNAVIKGLLADITAKLATAQVEIETLTKEKGELSTEVVAKRTEITGLNQKIKMLSDMAELDKGTGAQNGTIIPDAKNIVLNWDDDKQLGGITGEMYGMDRAYNQRLRAEMLYRKGIAVQVPTASSIDYSRLKEDLGAFYRVPWQDRLQSFLMVLPSIESIFPLESGYQDLAVLTNIWLGEFSQADNTASDFDNVTKGNYEFDNETLRMFSVMFAHKFKDLKALEKSWIGSYNKEGSQVIKWSFIEYILAETAKKLHNEREQRRVNGVRKEPDLNKPGRAMGAADGIYEFLNKKVVGHIDINNGKLVYQVKPFELGTLSPENIGEKVYQATSMIPAVLRDSGTLALYMPSHMIVWYHKYNELHYAQNQDYKANIMYVKEYPSVKLIAVPNADNHHRIFWTLEGNIHTFEDQPGEMTKFNIEQQDWTLKVWSNWKESTWAYAVGFKYTKKEDMDYSRQMIFCNEYDRPASYFIEADKDAQPSAKYHTSIVTVANTNLLAITDIEDAEVGKIVTLKCGNTNKGVKIDKSGNFSLISEAWNPKKGDMIRLMKRDDGKFIEIGRETGAADALQFAPDETTPSLQGGSVFVTGENTKATAITNFTDAIAGKTYTIHGSGKENASTIATGGSFVLTSALTLSTGKFIKLVKTDDGKFYEVARG